MHIYVMDSDYEVMKKLESVINQKPKCEAKCFTNTQSLIAAVRRDAPDAVLMDFDNPNSISAVKIMKSENPSIKTVIMSEEKNKALLLFEIGLFGFLLKPIDDEKLEEQIFQLQHPWLAKIKRRP